MEKIEINGKVYVEKNSLEAIKFTEDSSLVSMAIGKNVIVRSRNEGINAGVVVAADETGIVLKNCRRLYWHKPKDSSLSWYEGVAEIGISDDSKVSGTVSSKIIMEDYSITFCTNEAFESIMALTPNEQN